MRDKYYVDYDEVEGIWDVYHLTTDNEDRLPMFDVLVASFFSEKEANHYAEKMNKRNEGGVSQ